MKDIIEIFNLVPSRIFIFITTAHSTMFSGILIIFMFNKELFYKIDSIKLILIGIAITLPFYLVNSLILAFFPASRTENYKATEYRNELYLAEISSFSSLHMTVVIIIGYVWNLDFKHLIYTMVIVQIAYIIMSLINLLVSKYDLTKKIFKKRD